MGLNYSNSDTFINAKGCKDGEMASATNFNKGPKAIYDELIVTDTILSDLKAEYYKVETSDISNTPNTIVKTDAQGNVSLGHLRTTSDVHTTASTIEYIYIDDTSSDILKKVTRGTFLSYLDNVKKADRLTTGRVLSLTGDVTGAVTFDGTKNVSITAVVKNDSHLHAYSNLTSIPSTFEPVYHVHTDTPLSSLGASTISTNSSNIGYVFVDDTSDNSSPLQKVTRGTFLSYLNNVHKADKLTTARSISLAGDVTGSITFDGTKNVSITATVGNDSHSHAYSNLTGVPSTFTASSHTHAYIPTSTQTGTLDVNIVDFGNNDTLDFINNKFEFKAAGSAASSTVVAAIFEGKAISTNYADLAEKYKVNPKDVTFGSLLQFATDSEYEMEKFTNDENSIFCGVLSTQPGLMLNSQALEEEDYKYVALKGKVPAICSEFISKGEICMATKDGVRGISKKQYILDLKSAPWIALELVGVALEDSTNGVVTLKV